MKNALLAGTMLALCANLFGGSSVAAAPQGGSGVVTGVVLGADHQPVPHAVVTYQNAGGSAPHMAHADAHGHFTISKLKGDVYAIRATNDGLTSDWENVAVHPGKTRTIALHVVHEKEGVKQYTATHTYENQPE
jgi:Carboxypeptidase regulatory-like domain